jgi:hypothetical protein
VAQSIQHVKVQRKRWYDDASFKDNSAAPENALTWAIASSREARPSTSGGNTQTTIGDEVVDEDVADDVAEEVTEVVADEEVGSKTGKGKEKAGTTDRRESTAEEDVVIIGGSGGTAGEETGEQAEKI